MTIDVRKFNMEFTSKNVFPEEKDIKAISNTRNIITIENFWLGFLFGFLFFNWGSLHARLSIYYKVWSYKKKKYIKVKK